MISTGKALTESDGEVRRFINLVMLAAAEEFGVYPGEMVGSARVRPAAAARNAACAVLRRHVCERHNGNKVTFEIIEKMGMEHYPISFPNIGFLFCRDHSAFVHGRVPDGGTLDRIALVVWAAWPAVRENGLLPGLISIGEPK